MSTTATSRVTLVRRVGLGLVMVGGLSVSVRGQVEAVTPLLGGMSVVLALTNDLAALLALNEAISTTRASVRRWAWAVLVLAGGEAAGLNTWHAVKSGELPLVWALVVGIGPVLLATMLSHLVALVLEGDGAEAPHGSSRNRHELAVEAPGVPVLPVTAPTPTIATSAAAISSGSAPVDTAAEVPVPPAAADVPSEPEVVTTESSGGGEVETALPDPGAHHAVLAVVPSLRVLPAEAPRAESVPVAPSRTGALDRRVACVVEQLQDGVELTGASVGAQFACSERTGRRLLQKAEEHLATAAGDDVEAARETG